MTTLILGGLFFGECLTKMHSFALTITESTPEGSSKNMGVKVGTAATSTNDTFLGPAQIYSGNTFVQLGLAGEVSQGLEDFWTDPGFWGAIVDQDLPTASDKATTLARDPNTRQIVTTYAGGVFAGLNSIQNGPVAVDAGVGFSLGTNYTIKEFDLNLCFWK